MPDNIFLIILEVLKEVIDLRTEIKIIINFKWKQESDRVGIASKDIVKSKTFKITDTNPDWIRRFFFLFSAKQ